MKRLALIVCCPYLWEDNTDSHHREEVKKKVRNPKSEVNTPFFSQMAW